MTNSALSRFFSSVSTADTARTVGRLCSCDVAPQLTLNGTKSKRPPVRLELIDVLHCTILYTYYTPTSDDETLLSVSSLAQTKQPQEKTNRKLGGETDKWFWGLARRDSYQLWKLSFLINRGLGVL